MLLLEHSRSRKNSILAAYQDVSSSLVEQLGHGCVWNQDVIQLAQHAWKTSDIAETDDTTPIHSDRIAMELTRVDDALFGLITTLEATKL